MFRIRDTLKERICNFFYIIESWFEYGSYRKNFFTLLTIKNRLIFEHGQITKWQNVNQNIFIFVSWFFRATLTPRLYLTDKMKII